MARQRIAAASLAGLAVLHVAWATGATWPGTDRAALADAITGRKEGDLPGPAACLAVAGLLTTAAALVAGRPRRAPALSRLGSLGVTAVLATRGAFGLAGRTDLLVPGSDSERFRALDRRVFSPLCLTLAALAAPRRRG